MKKYILLITLCITLLSCNTENTSQINPSITSSSLLKNEIKTISKSQESNGLSLKNTPINKKVSLIYEAYKSTEVSKDEYSEHIYFFTTPFEENADIEYIDLEKYFADSKKTLSYKPYKHKNIFPYSFIH